MGNLIAVFILSVVLFVGPSTIFAQTATQAAQPSVPAGITPSNPLFFFESLLENIQLFLTANPQARAKLRLQFAAERLAEVKVEIALRNTRGLETALANLTQQLEAARAIIAQQAQLGQNVAGLAIEAQSLIEAQEEELADEVREEEIKIKGVVNALSEISITVAGITLARTPLTRMEGIVAEGSTVEVKAVVQSDGTLLAIKVEQEQVLVPEVKIEGILTALTDTSAQVAGLTVILTPATKREGVLTVLERVEVKATPQADGTIVARKIEAEDGLENEIKLKIKLALAKIEDEDDKLTPILDKPSQDEKALRKASKDTTKAIKEALKQSEKAAVEASKAAEKAAKKESKELRKEQKERAKILKESAKEAEKAAKELMKQAQEAQKRSEEVESKVKEKENSKGKIEQNNKQSEENKDKD